VLLYVGRTIVAGFGLAVLTLGGIVLGVLLFVAVVAFVLYVIAPK
jgi:hypothetical protein